MTRIGLIGVPLEEVPIIYDGGPIYNICAYMPGITNDARGAVIQRAKERGICVEDLGELCLGEDYSAGFINDGYFKLNGLAYAEQHRIRTRDMSKLEAARKDILRKIREFDLAVGLGPSHLGAIVLYEEGDVVARLDFHGDFANKKTVFYSYAAYLDWVKKNIRRIEVINYFVKQNEHCFFGRVADDSDTSYRSANLYDIDFDAVLAEYDVQTNLRYHGKNSGAKPEQIVSMIKAGKPKKLGFFEYRFFMDSRRIGLGIIVDSIAAALERKKEVIQPVHLETTNLHI